MKKIVVLLFVLVSIPVIAQKNQSVFVGLGGGLHSLQYKPVDGDHNSGMGASLDVRYNWLSKKHIGFEIGIQFANGRSYSSYNYEDCQDAVSYATTLPNPNYVHIAKYSDWKETQNLFSLNIPVELVYEQNLKRVKLQYGVGVQIWIPLASFYDAGEGCYVASGYFPTTNVTYEDMQEYGFGSNSAGGNYTGTFSAKSTVGILADFGVLVDKGVRTPVYCGLYFSYGLGGVVENERRQHLISQADDGSWRYNGTFNSDRVVDAHPLMVGLKVGLKLGLDKTRKNSSHGNGGKLSEQDADEISSLKQRVLSLENQKSETQRELEHLKDSIAKMGMSAVDAGGISQDFRKGYKSKVWSIALLRLQQPFDKGKVDGAVKDLESIMDDPQYNNKDVYDVVDLLKKYQMCNEELENIVREAQNDPLRFEQYNRGSAEKYKTKYRGKLEKSGYWRCRNLYSKSNLSRMIIVFENELNRHGKQEGTDFLRADFSVILETFFRR